MHKAVTLNPEPFKMRLADWWDSPRLYYILPNRIYYFLGAEVSDSSGEDDWYDLIDALFPEKRCSWLVRGSEMARSPDIFDASSDSSSESADGSQPRPDCSDASSDFSSDSADGSQPRPDSPVPEDGSQPSPDSPDSADSADALGFLVRNDRLLRAVYLQI